MQRVYLKGLMEGLWHIISYWNLSQSLKICTTTGINSTVVLVNIFECSKSNACMMPLHFKCTIMLYVLSQRYTHSAVGVRREGPTLLGESASLLVWARSLKIPVKKGRSMQRVQGES